jgi:hypothetical protein
LRLIFPGKKGVSVVEILLVTVIISLLVGGIFYILTVTHSLRLVSTAKIELQSEVRRAMDWIVNDVRQTVNYSIGAGGLSGNDPSSTHIKFKKVIDYDTAGSGSVLLGDFIEYTFDPSTHTITRTDLTTDQSWIFSNIVLNAPPFNAGIFYTRLSTGELVVIDPVTSGDNSPVYQTGNLIIVLTGQKQTHANTEINYTLKEEVKIRN